LGAGGLIWDFEIGKIGRLPKFLESLGHGVMEYWSVEKKDINSFVITPVLQYSEIN
jgi:hypothetical protein